LFETFGRVARTVWRPARSEMQNTSDSEKQAEAIRDFYEIFLPYYESMESMIGQLREAKHNIESLLK
jgi:hypothetical protein